MSRRTLYRINMKNGGYYVVASHPSAAVTALSTVLTNDGRNADLRTIEVICAEIREEDKPFHLNTGNELLIVP